MKEATGELNTTAIVAIAVAAFAAFFFSYLWPIIKQSINSDTKCADAICESCAKNDCEYVDCYLKDDPSNTFECVYKG